MTLYNFCNDVSTNEKNIQLNAMVLKLLIEIEDMLTNNILSNDPINKKFKFEKCNEDLNESQQLKSIIFKVFGITINNDYSIVDPAPFSNMEGKILNELKHSNEDIFNRLNKFYNDSIVILDEIEFFSSIYEQLIFYTTYVKFLKSVVNGGIVICKPIFDEDKFYAQDCASPSLITKCLENNTSLESIVTNDINLGKGEMFLLSGPNQGGKTIYLKSVGLNAYLAKCGCFVFCKSCFVPFYDVVATHFMRNEVLGKGRLIEEVERMERLFLTISSNSLILLNESFTSTRRRDGVQISIYYINKLFEIGCTIGFVSHYYEIPEIYNKSEMIISLSCGIDSNRRRTYEVTKSPTKRLAYAQDIVYKCGLTFEQLRSEIEVAKNEKD